MKKNGICTRKRPRSVEPITALSMLSQHRSTAEVSSIRTTAPALLQHPHWKLLPGTITEIAGPAGVGKTQMALTMCADSVVLKQKAIYILLGGSNGLGRISHRLETMLLARTNLLEKVQELRRRKKTSDALLPSTHVESSVTLEQIDLWLSNVYVQWIRNSEDLMELLSTRLPKLLATHPARTVRLIVLDGIAHIFRHAEDIIGMPSRQHWQARSVTFFKLSSLCKRLSDQFQIPFVIVNQATTRIDALSSTTNQEDRLEPALGLSWKQCVNSSFFVTSREAIFLPSNSGAPVRRRRLECLKAPHVPNQATMEFYIDQRGTVRICE